MASTLYKLINPPVKYLLQSPFHGIMSDNTLLLECTGRKSHRPLSTPISYHLESQVAHCFTSRSFGWWRNLTMGRNVQLTIRGQKWQSTPVVEHTDHELMRVQLEAFLRAVPRDAAHAGVALDKNENPNPDDILKVVPDLVYLKFPLEKHHE
ncbi:MAG: hypothetical protein VCA12_08385 [Pseudomonadales bacterium]